jgi:hypothetical protein
MKIEETANSDKATFATRPDARVDDPEAEEYRRGFGDGTVWATDYATEGQLRDFVEKLGQGGAFDLDRSVMRDTEGVDIVTVSHRDNPYWQGFIQAVEEVWTTKEPSVFGPEDAI